MIPRFPIILDLWLVLVKVACVEIGAPSRKSDADFL